MRIRNIKPDFFKNEELPSLPFEDRLLFIGLWCLADKNGVLEDRPKRIAVELFPYEITDASPMLDRLQAKGFIIRYTVNDRDYIYIPTFKKHQRISGKEAQMATTHPLPDGEATVKQPGSNCEAPGCFSGAHDLGLRSTRYVTATPGKQPGSTREATGKHPKPNRFQKPTLEELTAYVKEAGLTKVSPERFMDHYETNGWKVGKNPMKDWKAAARNWNRNDFGTGNRNGSPAPQSGLEDWSRIGGDE